MLIRAFPEPSASELPAGGVTVGRDWFAAQFSASQGLPRVDPKISGQHVTFSSTCGGVTVEAHAKAKNGVYLDGKRLEPAQPTSLRDGAVLRLGGSLFVFRGAFRGALAPMAPVQIAPPSPRRDPSGRARGKSDAPSARRPAVLVSPYGLASLLASLDHLESHRTILLEGSTGSGKELVAAVVASKLRRDGPYEAHNVAAVPAPLFAAYLFGQRIGDFTGAVDSDGAFKRVDGGTLFLDEIGYLSAELQPALLRVLDSGEVQTTGGRVFPVDVVVITATSKPLPALVAANRFHQDLYQRLSEVVLEVPPFSERREDVFAVSQELLRGRGFELTADDWEVEAIERLTLFPWADGNARQMRRVLLSAVMRDDESGRHRMYDERVLASIEREGRRSEALAMSTPVGAPPVESAPRDIDKATRDELEDVLFDKNDVMAKVAVYYGVSSVVVKERMKRLGIFDDWQRRRGSAPKASE